MGDGDIALSGSGCGLWVRGMDVMKNHKMAFVIGQLSAIVQLTKLELRKVRNHVQANILADKLDASMNSINAQIDLIFYNNGETENEKDTNNPNDGV